MQTKRERCQQEMTLLAPLEGYIPKDYPLYRLNRVLDLAFVHEAVRDRYCQDNGRPSVDPEVLIRLFLIQALAGITHVRELMREVQVNLAYRWFIGYRLDEPLPDHSTLSKALDRFGDEIFNELFERSIGQCKASGLIEGRVLHLDATKIRADLDANRVDQPDSPDPDARFGHFPGGQTKPGYRQQTVVDGRARVVVGLSVSPANRNDHEGAGEVIDQAVERLDASPEAVCADAAYGNGATRAAMEERGIRLVSPPRKESLSPRTDHFTLEDFTYDDQRDVFTCPAGATLHYSGRVKGRPNQRRYLSSQADCRRCPLIEQCTPGRRRQLKVSIHREALARLRADSETESFRQLYRSRAPTVEGVFAEAKQWHGLGRAWRRGLAKMRIQCWLIAAAINLKRLAAQSGGLSQIFVVLQAGIFGFIWLLRRFWDYPVNTRSITSIRWSSVLKRRVFQQAPSGGAPGGNQYKSN